MKRIVLSGICLLVLLGIAGTLSAQSFPPDPTPTWPLSTPYYCFFSINGGQGQSLVTLTLNGNNYLRRGTIQNVYPNGASNITRCTVTKPADPGSNCTQFEFTNNDNGIQCKDMVVCYGGSQITFDDCSNGALQFCYQ
jgi:hypothetical protein